jgi:GT2 family glycosyltransferase
LLKEFSEQHNNMTTIKLSIIIVSWNAQKYLSQCIESIVTAGIKRAYEIIVIDNNSDDGSQEMVREQFPWVVLICNEDNLGFAKANNIGIKHTQGEYVCLVNSDVVVTPGSIDSMIDFMEADPCIGLLGPQIVNANGAIQRSCMGFPTLANALFRAVGLDVIFPRSIFFGGHLLNFWNHNSHREVDIINGCFWMTRRNALVKVGLLDERFFMYGEDMDWCKRFRDKGWKVLFSPDVKVLHYGGASSANAPLRFEIEKLRANLQYWQKHHGITAVFAYRIILIVHHAVRTAAYAARCVLEAGKRDEAQYKMKRSFFCILFLLHFPEWFKQSALEDTSLLD